MADDDKAKAEKLAAAKKRVEALKKKKQTGGGAGSAGKKDKKDKAAAAGSDAKPATDVDAAEEAAAAAAATTETVEMAEAATADDDTKDDGVAVASPTSPTTTAAASSLSEQSRLRSTSFRHGADGETAADIYRKQAARIEDLERQNKRLAKEAADAEKRWQKAEDALADTREGSDSSELLKLKSEIAALQRQNTQLQARTSTRHGASPSISLGSPPTSELETQLRSKSQTIETMELELSRLRAQVERLTVGGADGEGDGVGSRANGSDGSGHGWQEQVAALEEKLERAEKAAGTAQRELAELKRNLDRTSEKVVREGSARTSAETKLRTLEAENEALRAEHDELRRKAEGLDKKVSTLTTLHKEHDARSQALRRDKERADRDLAETRTRLERAEAEALRLRKRDARDGGGTDDEHLDELLAESAAAAASSPEHAAHFEQLDRRVRELEAENADLRHGIWHERRKELQVGPDGTLGGGGGGGGGRHFSDVDLSPLGAGKRGGAGAGGALGDFFTAITGGGAGGSGHVAHNTTGSSHHHHHESDGFLDDDDTDFDEDAFRRAQEEEARQRLERVREAKRALKNWEGWRLDLVDSRQGGAEGIGPVFEI